MRAIDLPPVGSRVEGTRFEIKTDYDVNATVVAQRLEMAKDIAAFANALGGFIVVGAAQSDDGTLKKYIPRSEARRNELAELFERATRDSLVPEPVVDVAMVPPPDGTAGLLLVAEVHPFPGQAVGVRIPVERSDDVKGGDAWRFFVRVAAHALAYEPHQLGLIMDPSYRRKAQLLASIPDDAVVGVVTAPSLSPTRVTIVNVDVQRNVFFVKQPDGGESAESVVGIPIDTVHTVYPREPGDRDVEWLIQISSPHLHTAIASVRQR